MDEKNPLSGAGSLGKGSDEQNDKPEHSPLSGVTPASPAGGSSGVPSPSTKPEAGGFGVPGPMGDAPKHPWPASPAGGPDSAAPSQPSREIPSSPASPKSPSMPGKTPEVNIRTMQSDAEDMKKSGGAVPEPRPFSPPFASRQGTTGTPLSGAKEQPSLGDTRDLRPVQLKDKKKWTTPLILIVSLVVIIGVLGAVGYYIVWPIFFPATPSTPTPVAQQTPPPQQPTTPAPTPTETATTTDDTVTPPVLHASLFVTDPALSAITITLTAQQITPSSFRTLLGNAVQLDETERTAANGSAREIIIQAADGNPASFARVLSAFAPSFDFATLDALFEGDFTMFVYYDENGIWSGYIAKLKEGVSESAAQNQIATLEDSTVLSNFFVEDPTGAAETFKDGTLGARPVRYLAYAAGATFEYGWLNKHLVISTSYPGMQRAATLLGF